jgi:hypothetical protein
MKTINKRLCILIAVPLLALAIILIAQMNRTESSHWWLSASQPLRASLLSNQEIAGLEFAWYTLSNQTDRPVRYLRDRKAEEPYYSVTHRLIPDPATGINRITNHNQTRFQHVAPADLPPHSSIPFTVRYPSEATNSIITVSYQSTRSPFQSFLHNFTQRLLGKSPLPTNAYDRIELPHPLHR